MKSIKTAVVFLCIFMVSLQGIYAQELTTSSVIVDHKSSGKLAGKIQHDNLPEGSVQVAFLPAAAPVIIAAINIAQFCATGACKMLLDAAQDIYKIVKDRKEIYQSGKEMFQTVKEYTTKEITIEATNTGYTVVTEKMKGLGRQIEIEKIDKASAPSDASKLRETTGQENVTPVKVEFTQTFDGLFTQSANSPGSQIGTHSATLTDGTRVNVIGDSRAGNFTGSFKGDTVAAPGYTPATHNNSAFSGSSVGKISAMGLKEGDLRGTMTVTVPAGTQTVNVTGNITIKTDGSLSMPSYTGPITDNATSTKVGTMSGEWNQSKTTP